MQRKVLTRVVNGEVVDFIPYVDDLAVKIGGTNLRDYLAQIEENIQRSSLFLGAFENEDSLLLKYPNGTELEDGTYAIVSDEDALYIYDTDSLRWLKTASAILGILQLNGLTPVNGSLVITGGDIDSTVSQATTKTQKISEHLNDLYAFNEINEARSYGIVATNYNELKSYIEDNYIVYEALVYSTYINSKFIVIPFIKLSTTEEYSTYSNLNVKLRLKYSDGNIKNFYISDLNLNSIAYKDLRHYIGVGVSSYTPYNMIYLKDSYAILTNVNKSEKISNTIESISVNSSSWIDNEEGVGYKYVIELEENAYSGTYYLLSVYKNKGNIKTTAIIDYNITDNILTLYSDEIFDGGIVVRYLFR